MHHKSAFSALLCAGIAFVHLNAFAVTATKQRIGNAYDLSSCELVYREIHQETFKNGKIVSDEVRYETAKGDVVAAKTVSFENSLTMPLFSLVDKRNGYREGVREKTGSKTREVFVRKVNKQTEESRALQENVLGVIDAGFDQFVIQNWSALVNGERVKTEFLVPGFLRFFDFRIYRNEAAQSKPENAALATVQFVLEPDSIFLRALSDPIIVTYNASDKSLLEYVGVSNIRDIGGENLDVKILFNEDGFTRNCERAN